MVSQQRHAAWLAAELGSHREPKVLLQPENRDTAAGVLLPVYWIAARDPDATVVSIPPITSCSRRRRSWPTWPKWWRSSTASATARTPRRARHGAQALGIAPPWMRGRRPAVEAAMRAG